MLGLKSVSFKLACLLLFRVTLQLMSPPLMHNLTSNNVLGRIISLFRGVPSSRDLKILSRDDNIGYVCMERTFRKVRRLQPRSFGHKCASVMIQLSKGYDQSKIPRRKDNFFYMIGISSGKSEIHRYVYFFR